MTWLRVDDKFAEHGKLLRLPRADRWTWVELLCYCARQSNEGRIPAQISTLYRHATYNFLTRCLDVGLLDKDEATGDLVIHDFAVYNPKDPTGAVRQERYRNAKRNAERNDKSNASRAGTRARSRPDPTTPIEEGKGREVEEETDDAAPAIPNGATPLIDRMTQFVRQFWDEYPDLEVLQDELTDRGLSEQEARHVIANEHDTRQAIT